ncbi:MAG: hypothetical protein NT105_17070 [Verrucomicrobia bacterium]|nr:hypothetical protein [Verrucomicrobiota bacterium]
MRNRIQTLRLLGRDGRPYKAMKPFTLHSAFLHSPRRDPPTPSEMQAVANKTHELIQAMRR